jgi:hypothetical protein
VYDSILELVCFVVKCEANSVNQIRASGHREKPHSANSLNPDLDYYMVLGQSNSRATKHVNFRRVNLFGLIVREPSGFVSVSWLSKLLDLSIRVPELACF